MLSRVADSLYWMSRYLGARRAHHAPARRESQPDAGRELYQFRPSLAAAARRRSASRSVVKWDGNPYELARTLTFDTTLKSSSRVLHHCGAGKRATRARADLHRAVAPPELAVPRGHAPGVQACHACSRPLSASSEGSVGLPATGDGSRSPVPGRHRFHHEPRRRLAVHPGGPLSGARVRNRLLLEAYHEDLWADPERTRRGQRVSGVDGSAPEQPQPLRRIARSIRRTLRPSGSWSFCCSTPSSPIRCASRSTA